MKPNSLEAALARPKLAAVHDYSRSISKLKPKIRIIHIVEPEIITTTAEDFQQLVQRLTGKPVERKQSRNKKGNNASSVLLPHCIKTEEAPVLQGARRMKVEVEEICDAEDHILFSTFLEDIDGLFHDMNESPTLFSFRSSQINVFGEMPLC
ncbi:VQ motif-containing protein 18-like [Salvia splendens]|nr:VQ motif-containing protein 18-like [Salvia splendens]